MAGSLNNLSSSHHHDLAANGPDIPIHGESAHFGLGIGMAIASGGILVMLKNMFFTGIIAAGAVMALMQPNIAHAANATTACENNISAVLVDVSGFKARTGTLRVQLYAADNNYLEKRQWLERIDVPISRSGSTKVCVPVKRAGHYVVSVRHDLNGNGKSDRSDGGGLSGNPDMKLMDFISKRKPRLSDVSFAVGATTKHLPVTLNYVRGLSFQPVK